MAEGSPPQQTPYLGNLSLDTAAFPSEASPGWKSLCTTRQEGASLPLTVGVKHGAQSISWPKSKSPQSIHGAGPASNSKTTHGDVPHCSTVKTAG